MVSFSSERLSAGAVYTRKDLKALFGIKDASLNNGVFRPAGQNSVWLFVTESKTPDRTQYVDHLDGDVLHMEGQTQGRTDRLIMAHMEDDLELLVFHRHSTREYPGAGFRYEGRFLYVSHSGGRPTSFVLRREAGPEGPAVIREHQREEVERLIDAAVVEFNPSNIQDARERTLASIARRRGQPRFRRALFRAYGAACAISGCVVPSVLEAAHIHPYQGDVTDVVPNGILLRADIHTLFDLGDIWIEPDTYVVRTATTLAESEYAGFDGVSLRLPSDTTEHPSREALRARLVAVEIDDGGHPRVPATGVQEC